MICFVYDCLQSTKRPAEFTGLPGNSYIRNGGLDIRTESKLLSTVYEITVNGVPLRGRIFAWRDAGSPAQDFTIRFLSPSEIALTVLYENQGPRKAILRKQGDFRARAWLLQ